MNNIFETGNVDGLEIVPILIFQMITNDISIGISDIIVMFLELREHQKRQNMHSSTLIFIE